MSQMTLMVTWTEELDSEAIVRDVLPNSDDESVRDFAKKIGLIWQVFQVSYEKYSWKIIKNHSQIQDFILEYNLKFKSKLTFEQFKVHGIEIVCKNQEALYWSTLHEFLETKDRELGKIGSFQLLKKSGGRFKDICCRLPWQWSKRSFVVTTAGVMYYAQPSKQIKEYIPFNCRLFRITCGKIDTDHDQGILLQASHRKLLLYADNWNTFFKFVYCIKENLKKLEGPDSNPFQSYAPARKLQHIQFLVDGEEYFRAVCHALEKAEWQIMICGWWISPQFQLMRPVNQYPEQRLDSVLEKVAARGVKIFILVYNESSFLTNDSAYTKQIFQNISPNIKVVQHPLGVLPTFWSHHQKAVIVDQSEVIMGGLDLCYGRYDTSEHLIWETNEQWYPGIEYNNIRTRDFTKVRQFWKSNIARVQPRLPWHDVGVKFSGEAAQDVCHHFIEYWNYASFQTHFQDRYVLILQKDRSTKIPLMKRIKEGINSKIQSIKNFAGGLRQKLFKKQGNQRSQQKNDPKDLQEQQIKVQLQHETQYENNSNKHMLKSLPRDSEERMIENGKLNRSNYKSQEFKQRMLSYQTETTENKFIIQNNSIRKTIVELDQMVEEMSDNIENIDYINDVRVTNNAKLPVIDEEEEYFSCQILRSVGGWSIGCDASLKEESVYKAYITLIQQAENFIYIENQFFISAVEGSPVVKNHISDALFNRVMHAHQKKTQFKVIIVLPMIPGFAGELDDPEAVIPRVIMHWQYQTISRNQNSLFGRLIAKGVHPDQYISFFSLRTHGVTKDEPIEPATEIVYLHSKLMIVDDRRVIIGSANLNDRSLRGSRDSELCLFVEGKSLLRVSLGGRTDDVSEKIQNFRIKLWKEHFGDGISYQNPLQEECLRQIKKRASNNTLIYRQVFNCYPDDNIPTFKHLSQWRQKRINESLYKQVSKQIIGTVVQYPLQFLKDENLLVGSTLYPDSLSV